jgi:hypothetical protein
LGSFGAPEAAPLQKYGFSNAEDALVRGGDPEHVGIEEKEEDQADGHEVHVDAEHYAGVVEVPAALHAADGVQGAGHGDEGGQDEQWSGTAVREVREEKRGCQAEKDEEIAAEEGAVTRVEDGVFQMGDVALEVFSAVVWREQTKAQYGGASTTQRTMRLSVLRSG